MFRYITGVKKQVFTSSCLYLGLIGAGFFTAWPGSITPKLKDPEQSPLAYNLTETELPLVGTITYIGALPGPFVSGWLSNTIGRKPCIIGATFLTCVGACIQALPTNLATIYCTRVLTGFSIGIFTVMSIVYIGEIASTNIRGILLVVVGICQVFGSMVLFVVAPFLSYTGTTFVGFGIHVAVLIWSIMIPESPMFYILKGNDEKVIEILTDMGRSEDADKLLSVKNEYLAKSSTQDWLEIFTIKSNRKAFFIGAMLNIFQNCSGFIVVLFFCATIFKLAGSSVDSDISMVVIGCFQLLGSTLSSIMVERTGRKSMFLISAFLCSLSMFLLGLYFYMNSVDSSLLSNFKWFPLLSLIVYFISYNFGLGVVPHVVIGEMFTPNVRSKGSTLVLTLSWLCGFFMTTGCGILLEITGGHVTFWLFTCVNASAFVFSIFFFVETKGKTLLEIQEILNK